MRVWFPLTAKFSQVFLFILELPPPHFIEFFSEEIVSNKVRETDIWVWENLNILHKSAYTGMISVILMSRKVQGTFFFQIEFFYLVDCK